MPHDRLRRGTFVLVLVFTFELALGASQSMVCHAQGPLARLLNSGTDRADTNTRQDSNISGFEDSEAGQDPFAPASVPDTVGTEISAGNATLNEGLSATNNNSQSKTNGPELLGGNAKYERSAEYLQAVESQFVNEPIPTAIVTEMGVSHADLNIDPDATNDYGQAEPTAFFDLGHFGYCSGCSRSSC